VRRQVGCRPRALGRGARASPAVGHCAGRGPRSGACAPRSPLHVPAAAPDARRRALAPPALPHRMRLVAAESVLRAATIPIPISSVHNAAAWTRTLTTTTAPSRAASGRTTCWGAGPGDRELLPAGGCRGSRPLHAVPKSWRGARQKAEGHGVRRVRSERPTRTGLQSVTPHACAAHVRGWSGGRAKFSELGPRVQHEQRLWRG
jgi:hypothetical protein